MSNNYIQLSGTQTAYLSGQDLGSGVQLPCFTPGGTLTATIAAGTGNATAAVKASAARFCKVLVTATGAAVLNFYDNATGAAGTLVGVIAASAAVGVQTFDMPCANGIVASGANGSPAVTVSYI